MQKDRMARRGVFFAMFYPYQLNVIGMEMLSVLYERDRSIMSSLASAGLMAVFPSLWRECHNT